MEDNVFIGICNRESFGWIEVTTHSGIVNRSVFELILIYALLPVWIHKHKHFKSSSLYVNFGSSIFLRCMVFIGIGRIARKQIIENRYANCE